MIGNIRENLPEGPHQLTTTKSTPVKSTYFIIKFEIWFQQGVTWINNLLN